MEKEVHLNGVCVTMPVCVVGHEYDYEKEMTMKLFKMLGSSLAVPALMFATLGVVGCAEEGGELEEGVGEVGEGIENGVGEVEEGVEGGLEE